MTPPTSTRPWRRCRCVLRCCRRILLLAVLAAVGALFYLDRVGLPDFVKRPLLEKLRSRGIELQFTRMRWRPDLGIVAENVRFGSAPDANQPPAQGLQLALKRVQVRLDYGALARGRLQVDSLMLRQGRLTWPADPSSALAVSNIQTELRLLPHDSWQLDQFQAQLAGATIQMAGVITNASALRNWKWFRHAAPGSKRPPAQLQQRLTRLAETLEKIHFGSPPRLTLVVHGDARDYQSFDVRLFVRAPSADTPWGQANQSELLAQFFPAQSNANARADIRLRAAAAQTRWVRTRGLALDLQVNSLDRGSRLVRVWLDARAATAQNRWGTASNARFTARWTHSLTNPVPIAGQALLSLDNAVLPRGSARQLQISASLSPSTPPVQADASWAWWTNIQRFDLAWKIRAAALRIQPRVPAPGAPPQIIRADQLLCSGQWHAPQLDATQLVATLYGGHLNARAGVDIATRAVQFQLASDFDVHGISPLLSPFTRRWLENYSWQKPPRLQAQGALRLPAAVWSRRPNWREVPPTTRLSGQFHIQEGAFRGVNASTADSHFVFSNMVWHLPDLVVSRPEGRLELVHDSDERTHQFYFGVHSTIDVRALGPLLPPGARRALDLVGWTEPPEITGQIRGRWHAPESLAVTGRVAAAHFTIRGEPVARFQSLLSFTNAVLKLFEPRLTQAGTNRISAQSLTVDFAGGLIRLTNGLSTADPMSFARAVGPHVARALEPYHFFQPPRVRAQGVIPTRSNRDADLHFEVEGGPFGWWKLHAQHITGRVDWVGRHLMLNDVRAEFYHGAATGGALFDFGPDRGTDFNFNTVIRDADLHLLADDLLRKTNNLEGPLSAGLQITHANTRDWQSWQGAGRVDLRNGLIWDIPLFGIFSPLLDSIMPGLGSSRASEGSASFEITNGIAYCQNLEIQTLMARLEYRGTLDLTGRVQARMDAEPLRNVWGVGPVLGLALWPVSKVFEYKITGTVSKPDIEPVFLPKFLFFPLHPVRSLKGMFPASSASPTNAPSFSP